MLNQHRTNEKGFTLIEALLCLVILGIFTTLSVDFVLRLTDYIRLNSALSVFQDDLHYSRVFNMLRSSESGRMSIRILHENNRYEILVNDVVQKERELPRGIRIPSANQVSTLSFNERGNLGQGRTLVFASNYRQRQVVFSIGVGGFDVRE